MLITNYYIIWLGTNELICFIANIDNKYSK